MSPSPSLADGRLAALRRFAGVRAASLGLKVAALGILLFLVSRYVGGL